MSTIIGVDGADQAGSGPRPPADLIKDSNSQQFAKDVIDASMRTPVIVDFWAPWCEPCKQLGPAIEKAVTAARGAVRLVKINIDENQDLAQQMRIQSVPAVYAFHQGRPVDGFVGALPDSQIKAFIDRLSETAGTAAGPDPVGQALEEAQKALDGGQLGAASALFGQVLQYEAENQAALAGMMLCRLASGDAAGARAMFESLPQEQRDAAAFASVAAKLELAALGEKAGEIGPLKERLDRDPNDHQARFDLALALHAAGQAEPAAEALLEIIRRNRAWNEEAARKQLLKFFEAWGPTDPMTLNTRRQLSSLLFS